VTHLEVTPQNVKQPKTGRNSGHVRNSDKYGTGRVATMVHYGEYSDLGNQAHRISM
jgi:hypothetical protein